MLRQSVALAGTLWLAACATDPAVQRPQLESPTETITPQAIAESFERAYTTTAAIHVQRRSFENGRPSLDAESWITRESVRTDVYAHGVLVYSLTVRGMRAQERIPNGVAADGVRGPRFEDYQLASPHSIDRPRLVTSGWACRIGDQFGSLLAADQRIVSAFAQRLPTCTLLGAAEVQRTRCAVPQWESTPHDPADPSSFRQGAIYYVDVTSGWMLRHDQYQQERGRRVERVSLYSISPADPAPALFELPRN